MKRIRLHFSPSLRPCEHHIEIPTNDPRFNLCLDCRASVVADFPLRTRSYA